MIFGCRHQPRTIFLRRELQVVRQDESRGQSSQFHECEVLADAAEGAHAERCEGILVLDFVFLAVPSLGDELFGVGVDGFVCLKSVS